MCVGVCMCRKGFLFSFCGAVVNCDHHYSHLKFTSLFAESRAPRTKLVVSSDGVKI